jgi:hypothetical protein
VVLCRLRYRLATLAAPPAGSADSAAATDPAAGSAAATGAQAQAETKADT